MNPAPPVTSSLCTHQTPQHELEINPPRAALQPERRRGAGCVECAVAGPLSRAGAFFTADGPDRHGALEQPEREGLLLDRDGEFVPTRHAGIGPVMDAGNLGSLGRGPDRLRERSAPGRRAELIAHHPDLLLILQDAQHGEHDVAALPGVEPGGPEDDGVAFRKPRHLALARQLGAAVHIQRMRWIPGQVRAALSTVEDIVGRQMDQPGTHPPALPRQIRRTQGVHRFGPLRVTLCGVDLGVGRRVDHHRRPFLPQHVRDGLGTSDVQLGRGIREGHPAGGDSHDKLLTELAAGTRDHGRVPSWHRHG
jgi:hypothetical protein